MGILSYIGIAIIAIAIIKIIYALILYFKKRWVYGKDGSPNN